MWKDRSYTGTVLFVLPGKGRSDILVQADKGRKYSWHEERYPMRMVRIFGLQNQERHEDKPLPKAGERIEFRCTEGTTGTSLKTWSFLYAEVVKYPDPERKKMIIKEAEVLLNLGIMRKYQLQLGDCEDKDDYGCIRTIWVPFWEEFCVGDEVEASLWVEYIRKCCAEGSNKWRRACRRR